MDLLESQAATAAIEESLNYIQSQGPEALEHLKSVLAGAASNASVLPVISQKPVLLGAIDQLLILINSGAGIAEIATQLVAWAVPKGISINTLVKVLYLIVKLTELVLGLL